MFKKEEKIAVPSRSDATPSTTIIGNGTSFNGVLRVNGSLRIEGEVEGQVFVTQGLVVGAGGLVKAEVVVDSAVVAGRIQGRIRAKGKVLLQKGSRLEGDVHASTFQIEDGAFFQGNCAMGEDGTRAQGVSRSPGPSDKKLRVVGP